MGTEPVGVVVGVHRHPGHGFSKLAAPSITLVAGLGVEGDAHFGARVQHRSRVRVDPDQPNLRQVHLLQQELFEEVSASGFAVGPGDLGENVTTAGIDLLPLPVGTMLRIGADALVALTGLRNPCRQIDAFSPGLLGEVRVREAGEIVVKAGVMGVVVRSGVVAPGDRIQLSLPPAPHHALERV